MVGGSIHETKADKTETLTTQKVLERAAISHIRFEDMRHTCTVLALQKQYLKEEQQQAAQTKDALLGF